MWIIESSQKAAYQAVNTTLVRRNWLLGYRIASEEMQGEDRARYGAEIIKKLAKELSAEYGKGYTKTNLYSFYSFYKTYPEIFHSPSGRSDKLLSWTHYRDCCRLKIQKPVPGTKKKQLNKPGGPYFTAKYFFPVLLPYAPNTKSDFFLQQKEKNDSET